MRGGDRDAMNSQGCEFFSIPQAPSYIQAEGTIRVTYDQPRKTLSISSTDLKAQDIEAIVLSTTTADPIAQTILASIVRVLHSVFEGRRAT
jgi:hypothetical protein